MQVALEEVGAADLYDSTGVQIIPINSIFGLLADVRTAPDRLAAAERLLMMPDVFHHLLSGSMVTEYTAASTSAAYDMAGNRWATELLDRLGIPTRILPEVVPPGTDVGSIIGVPTSGALAGARVIVPPGHDTASAVVAIPFADAGALFISSGTWSLVGVETDAAVINAGSRRANLTNEGGYAGTIRLLRNVMGLWVLQQCRRQWAAEGKELSYQEIADLAAVESGWVSVVDLDDELFLAPGDMPRRIREYCARNGSPVPQSIGATARCVVDSLALSYRAVVDDIAEVTGRRPASVSVVGGGANHRLLSQLTADATGLTVRCGPIEASALGNGAVQLAALGELDGPAQIREVVARSNPPVVYLPRPDDRWLQALPVSGHSSTTGSPDSTTARPGPDRDRPAALREAPPSGTTTTTMRHGGGSDLIHQRPPTR